MANSLFYSESMREKCCFCNCKGHDPCLKTNVDEDNIRYYLVNREQLNELWICCIEEQHYFCKEETSECRSLLCSTCEFVNAFYRALLFREFFDIDKDKEGEPVLWKVFTCYLDKSFKPLLVKIEIVKRM